MYDSVQNIVIRATKLTLHVTNRTTLQQMIKQIEKKNSE